MKAIIEQLLDKEDLSREKAYQVMLRIMSGEFDDAQIAGFLIALRAKGETPVEIAGFAQAMREKMTPVSISNEAIDMCGTGGDAKGTFNISTAASIVAAGAGVKVAKHGNRSMTSKSGSADVLTALGVDIAMPPEKMAHCVDEIGLGFLFAPALHPAMKHAIGARKSLAVRTVFNILGPLCNPAGVKRQVIGVFDGELTQPLAEVLRLLGAEEAYVVHGRDGMDEFTTTAPSKVSHLDSTGNIESMTLSPEDFGLETTTIETLQGGDPSENAAIIRSVLAGEKGPRRDVVLLNAAAGIAVGGKAATIGEAMQLAVESIDSGAALNVLEKLARA
ncbi:MAG: anthranilate phosphoribosyltransferase [FCB group bacterium]|nr:anthranilate phosphoribosyltransferase [FCB group bacterium]